MNKADAVVFYEEIIRREEEITAIKDEIDAAMLAFASSNDLSLDGVKKGVKEHKAYQKNPARFLVVDADADKVFEAMAG